MNLATNMADAVTLCEPAELYNILTEVSFRILQTVLNLLLCTGRGRASVDRQDTLAINRLVKPLVLPVIYAFACIDARERKEYEESHIIVARHAPICVCSTIIMRKSPVNHSVPICRS